MENFSRFKERDVVIATDECIKKNVAFTAGRPVDRPDLPYTTYFECGKKYIVKETGKYNDGWHILVRGSTQFVHEKYFDFPEIKIENEDSININGIDYYLVPKSYNSEATQYYELIREYPGSPELGTKVMVHGTCVNFVKTVHSMEGIPKYEHLIKFSYFWKKTCI